MTEGLYYEHSGKSSLSGPPAGLILGILAGVPLAFIYSYVILYIPVIGYFTVLLSLAFGAIVGKTAGAALRWTKVRNTGLAVLVTFLVACGSLYVSWAAWIYALLRRAEAQVTLLSLILRPYFLWAVIRKVNQVGAWTLSGSTPTGIVLWVLWALEAAVIVGVAVVVARSLILADPFCESCEAWCKKVEGACQVKAADPAEIKQRMESKDFSYLEKMGAVEPGGAAWVRLDLHSCPACHGANTLSAESVTLAVDKRGKKTKTTKTLIAKLLVSPAEADAIRQIGQKLAASPAS